MNEAQTREDLINPAIRKAGWTKTSCPLLAGEGLEVAFPQVERVFEALLAVLFLVFAMF